MISYIDITAQVQVAEELRQLAMTDELTGLYNRRYFFHLADRELHRFTRYGRPLSLVVLDIDHFKQVNDRFGHAAGDVVLRSVAQDCLAALRTTDVIARIDGEEFTVLMTETPSRNAFAVAERLRQKIAATSVPFEDQSLSVTVSLGVVEASSKTEYNL